MSKSRLYKINKNDNVAVVIKDDNIPFGHKVALFDMQKGDNVIKYGYPIGHLTCDVKKGEHIHSHNLETNLTVNSDFSFSGENDYFPNKSDLTFNGFLRSNNKAGIRNEIWIITTVGCVSKTALQLEKIGNDLISDGCAGVYAFTHPFGCSQLGDDQENTRKILSGLINHPNAGGVLVLSLGCENTNVEVLKSYLGDIDENRVKFLICQDVDDEIEEGKKLISQLYENIKNDKRQPLPLSKLTVGFKCGGSDAFSGITANPLCGMVCDKLTENGATTILTEVPEMFGAEKILLDRCKDKAIFEKLNNTIQAFKDYYVSHNQPVGENPSPGNHDGGITTLEEKSLGCVQKGGKSVVTDVLQYGETCKKSGLNILNGPGNDIVSITNMTASGAQLILFTTGRGTPLGAPVPTIKISTNTHLYNKKSNWIDFNAGDMLDDATLDDNLFNLLLDVANGKKTLNEKNGYREISIFKDGVVL